MLTEDTELNKRLLELCAEEGNLLELDRIVKTLFSKYMYRVLTNTFFRYHKLPQYKYQSYNGDIDDILDTLVDNATKTYCMTKEDMLNSFTDDLLFELCNSLKTKEQEILFCKYELGLTDKEIANRYRQSRQSIQKSRVALLNRLYKSYTSGR